MRLPKGKWGTADHLEPITVDYPEFGSGGVPQVITNSPIKARKIVNTETGEVLYKHK